MVHGSSDCGVEGRAPLHAWRSAALLGVGYRYRLHRLGLEQYEQAFREFAPENQVRTGLTAGGNRMRTIGSAGKGPTLCVSVLVRSDFSVGGNQPEET